MKFPLAKFQKFCSELVIDSKELGQIRMNRLLGTQSYAIQEIVRGLEDGIHHFDILKARQHGITTICLALDLFWVWYFKGMQATLAADAEENRDMFRSTLTMYYDGLPRSHRVPLIQNNRNLMSFQNRSRLMFQVAGGAKSSTKGGKGRGKGLTFIHATETASWSDAESLASILASLAETNPQRLFIFESTARGFNMRHEMWSEAKDAVSQKAIFIGWWMNELYRKEKDTAEYKVYWDGKLTGPEREWVQQVKFLYKHEITPEQMAWWRWKLQELIHDENLMMQEFPPTEEHAFILSGDNFFAANKTEETLKQIEAEPSGKHYRFRFGDEFMQTELEETIEKMGDLTIWEEPDEVGFYSIGGDPAFGSSDWADRFAIEVHRCYSDRIEQVAEYCVTDISTYRYAWVLVYLAGLYKNTMINLEVNGPGQAVLAEMNALRKRAASLAIDSKEKGLKNVVQHMRYYLYRRLDSPGGAGYVYHWKTTHDTKERMLNNYRDLYYRGQLVLHSKKLVEEMRIVVREDGILGASGRGKDDRVIATALSSVQYVDFIKDKLEQMKISWAAEQMRRRVKEERGQDPATVSSAASRSVTNYLSRMGVKQK